jgi:glycosyltransferase involved in cell wall biosynthesis
MTTQNKPPKIAYVVKMFPRISETFILNEMLELERQGVEITVFSLRKPNEGKFHPQLSDLQAQVFYLDDFDTKKWASWLGEAWPRLQSDPADLWKLVGRALNARDVHIMDYVLLSAWTAAKSIELDISHVHSHFASLPSTIAWFAGSIASIPFSFTAHAKDIYVYDMEEHFHREKLFSARFVVTVTEYNKEYICNENPDLDPEKIRVVHNGVNLDSIRPASEDQREKNLILGVGRLVPKKGFDTLLDACDILKNRGIDFKCLIAGKGTDTDMLLARRDQLDLGEAVEFAGAATQDQIIKLMRKATVLCLPCRIAEDGNRDALPTVLLEALACGLPVVSTNISGIPEIVESGKNGILVDPDDPAALADELEKLLGSQNLRRQFAKAGIGRAKDSFDIIRNVGELKKLFSESICTGVTAEIKNE